MTGWTLDVKSSYLAYSIPPPLESVPVWSHPTAKGDIYSGAVLPGVHQKPPMEHANTTSKRDAVTTRKARKWEAVGP